MLLFPALLACALPDPAQSESAPANEDWSVCSGQTLIGEIWGNYGKTNACDQGTVTLWCDGELRGLADIQCEGELTSLVIELSGVQSGTEMAGEFALHGPDELGTIEDRWVGDIQENGDIVGGFAARGEIGGETYTFNYAFVVPASPPN
jgi:hypothetical protein